MTATPIEKRTRAVNVQVPGEAPAQPEQALPNTAASGQAAFVPPAPPIDEAKPEVLDLDAIRMQIRAEEQASIRAELGAQIQAAASVVSQPALGTVAASRSNYRTMRAADIDHTKLTAPVLCLDGWVCPPAPEAKK